MNCTTDQIAKWDGAKWACAPDETGVAGDQDLQDQINALQALIDALPPPPSDGGIGILLDDDGATIGKIVAIPRGSPYRIIIVMDIPPHQILMTVEKPSSHAQRFDLGGFEATGLDFATSDCTGTAYRREPPGSKETRLAPHFSPLISGHTIGRDTVDDHRLYIPSGDGPTTITSLAQMDGGDCTPITPAFYDDAIPLTLLVPDLHAIHPRPYSVVLY